MDSQGPQNTPAEGGRRRSSNNFMPAFESLSHQKRGSEDHIARRQSMTDQHVKGGIFSTFFHNTIGKNASK
ncbi:hypothetical protein S7711_00883 [Stachybotrys chartarum IBT 7711]|uniref:Conidiation-specific protein 8 n=1 Tax=Stachybotrys chartarum (strain CBS 109288 / IBT 7711) TaxID=1280523 RepID=A0A084B0I0_STACB|nr:hypothetical protein S7711_00883 [Stachybotrys chartarum IBT 7711]KFA50222.1 hypothetical protein S40293_03683 [Stachybotrys chartarum IBT 40293]KFA72620.1 hypothetical protein S40288_08791 [Stachybotrys chartarum IBT 40288]